MSGLFLIVISLLVCSPQAFLFPKDFCKDQTNCVSCTSHKSWSGNNCRWCPDDNKCHTFASVQNPCARAENIINKDDCDKIIFAEYDPNLAYKMVFLSALAYSDNVANYISKATAVNTFRLVKQVTKDCAGNAKCSGYTAVSHTEKAIAVAFRGSEHFKQVIEQALSTLTQPKVPFGAGGKVQAYFRDAFVLVWNELRGDVYRQMKNYPSYKVWVTGHSLGGALASLASTLLAYEQKTAKGNLILYTFGQPRVGNYEYAFAHDKLVPISFRVTHFRDPVVHLPTCSKIAPATPCLANGGPYHHGKEVYYDKATMTKYSSYKKCEGLPHNEDLGCSNSVLKWIRCFSPELPKCIEDHKMYFSLSVGTWWKSQ